VFFDWNKPYWDSMGLSVPVAGINVWVKNNYLRQNAYQGVWGEPDSSGVTRGSYGIESSQAPAGMTGGIVEGNIIGSEKSVMAVAAPGKDTLAMSNLLFGRFSWGEIGGEPGSLGWGSVIEHNNVRNRTLSQIPLPPPISVFLGSAASRMLVQTPMPTGGPDPDPTLDATPPTDSRYISVSHLPWMSATNDSGAGPVELNMTSGGVNTGDGAMLTVNGKQYDNGLGVSGNSEVIYQLNGQFAKFAADIGVDDESGKRAAMSFQVWGDGRLLYDSSRMTSPDGAKSISIDTTGVRELKLITVNLNPRGGQSSAHGDWASARLIIDPMAQPHE
jgi:hypothetical protein